MRTQLMLDRAAGMPWLEHDTAEGGPPECVPLPSFPFTLGRSESADFTINSGRVSREHAMILHENGKYRVRDLGSTNGTFLNGQRIEDEPLDDGDLLVLADTEFTFYLGRPETPQRMVTQVMGPPRKSESGEGATEVIREVRQLHEMLTHRAITSLFIPLVDLASREVVGYEAVEPCATERSRSQRQVLGTECRAVARLRHLRRLVAVEEAASFPSHSRVFLALDPSELGSPGLADSLGTLREMLAEGRDLVVEMPDSAVSDTPYYRQLRQRMQAIKIAIAHVDFAAGPSQLAQQAEICPDYLRLASPLVRAIHRARSASARCNRSSKPPKRSAPSSSPPASERRKKRKPASSSGAATDREIGAAARPPPSTSSNTPVPSSESARKLPVPPSSESRAVPLLSANMTDLIDGYSIRERIGTGGYGEVWKADAPGGLSKAIKFVYGQLDEERAAASSRPSIASRKSATPSSSRSNGSRSSTVSW